MMKSLRGGDAARGCVAAMILALAAIPRPDRDRTAEPIKIGFGMALTGGLAAKREVCAPCHENLGRGYQCQRVGDYGTNLLAPAMPVIISHNMTFIGLFGLAVNNEFNYPKYFSTFPTGPRS